VRGPWLFLAIAACLAVIEVAAGAAGWLPHPLISFSIDGSDDWYR
jgi:hypothetical protein